MNINAKKVPVQRGRLLLYAVCILLAVFYIVVMWWGITPKVGIEYKMYYITHELSDWPGYGKLDYIPGTEEIATSRNDRDGNAVEWQTCMRKGQGWEKEQYEGSTNKGGVSYIYYVPTQTADNCSYTVEIKDFDKSKTDASVCVYVNGRQVGNIDGTGAYTFEVGNISQDELFTVSFDSQNSSFTLWSACLWQR